MVTLANRGKLAAHLVTGWVRLDAAHLESLKHFEGTNVSLREASTGSLSSGRRSRRPRAAGTLSA